MTGRFSKIAIVSLVTAVGWAFGGGSALAAEKMVLPDVKAPAAYLIDVQTGRVLFEKGARERRAVASTTKIMTALLVLELSKGNEIVTVSPKAASVGGATINLKAGETRGVAEMLNALMLASANDAAVALAEQFGGSEAGFARLMNDRARQLGAVETRFVSPHGLASGSVHYSTAADMAVIAGAAMKRPDFKKLVSTRYFTWNSTDSAKPVLLTNSNHLLERYPAANGIKTGFTGESGYCLVSGGVRGARQVVAVVLGSPSREESFLDTRNLLEFGLKAYEFRSIVVKNRQYGRMSREGKTIPLIAGRTLGELVYVGGGSKPSLTRRLRLGARLPIKKGERLGRLRAFQMGKELGSVELLAGRSVERPYLMGDLMDHLRRVVKKMENLL